MNYLTVAVFTTHFLAEPAACEHSHLNLHLKYVLTLAPWSAKSYHSL